MKKEFFIEIFYLEAIFLVLNPIHTNNFGMCKPICKKMAKNIHFLVCALVNAKIIGVWTCACQIYLIFGCAFQSNLVMSE